MKTAYKSIALTTLACALGLGLTGCGGGGGDNDNNASTPPTAPSTRSAAEGIWCGTASNGLVENFVVLDDGQAWGFFGVGTCGGYISIDGSYHGTVTVNGNSISGFGTEYDFGSGILNLSVAGTVSAAQNQLTFTSPVALTANYVNAYDQPATLASMAGSYSGPAETTGGFSPQVRITVSGSSLTMPADAAGCSAQGTITPHVTQRGVTVGVFDVNMRLSGGSVCVLGSGVTTQGIALLTADGQILTGGLTANGSQGFFYIGRK